MTDHEKNVAEVQSIATQISGVSVEMSALYGKLALLLKREFEYCDSGMGGGQIDLHFPFGDTEYYCRITPNRTLSRKDSAHD